MAWWGAACSDCCQRCCPGAVVCRQVSSSRFVYWRHGRSAGCDCTRDGCSTDWSCCCWFRSVGVGDGRDIEEIEGLEDCHGWLLLLLLLLLASTAGQHAGEEEQRGLRNCCCCWFGHPHKTAQSLRWKRTPEEKYDRHTFVRRDVFCSETITPFNRHRPLDPRIQNRRVQTRSKYREALTSSTPLPWPAKTCRC